MELLKLSFPKPKNQIEMIFISIFIFIALAFGVFSIFQQKLLLNSSAKNSKPYMFFFLSLFF